MEHPDQRIARFLRKHHVLTLATTVADCPHCSSLFYAYSPEENRFVVSSSENTLHVQQIRQNSRIAASMVLETRIVGKLQGIQLRGSICEPDETQSAWARKTYFTKFPYAAAIGDLQLWIITPDYLKLTDNTLGFGKKITWEACAHPL